MKRHILITGATGSIGREVVKSLASPDVNLFIHCKFSAEEIGSLKFECEEMGARVHAKLSDISNIANAIALVGEACDQMGGLDAIVHCAAIFRKTPLGDVSEETWNEMIDTNLKSSFFLAQAASEKMKENGGSIIMLTDIAASRPYAGYLPYCISKAGIDAMIKGLAKALAPKITVNGVAPYAVTRPNEITDEGWNDMMNKIPLHRPSTAREIADIIKFLLQEDSTITGEIVRIDGGRSLR